MAGVERMTHLPLENRDVWGVPGEKYDPAPQCAHPFCHYDGGTLALERHHLWPRSFLRHQPTEWVKLPDERVVQNCVYLCREHHQQITENKAKIEWRGHNEKFWWSDVNDMGTFISPLSPQPRFRDSDEEDVPQGDSEAVESVTEPSRGITWVPGHEPHVPQEGEECGLCKRRVPKKRKPTTPVSTPFSFRLPVDEKEELKEIIEAAAKHLGVYEAAYPHYRAVLQSLVLALQGPGAEE